MKEIVRWNYCGMGIPEQVICESIVEYEEDQPDGVVGVLLGNEVQYIIDLKNQHLFGSEQPYSPHESIWPTREYYLYYNFHPNSGYRTEILGEGEDEVVIRVKPNQGLALQAFWSEVIIFRRD